MKLCENIYDTLPMVGWGGRVKSMLLDVFCSDFEMKITIIDVTKIRWNFNSMTLP